MSYCKKSRKAECIASPDCKWRVGEGCSARRRSRADRKLLVKPKAKKQIYPPPRQVSISPKVFNVKPGIKKKSPRDFLYNSNKMWRELAIVYTVNRIFL